MNRKSIQKPFNRGELIKELKEEFERLNSTSLTVYDKNRRSSLPSSHRVRAKLGGISWEEVVRLTGFKHSRKNWSKERIVEKALSKNRRLSYKELLEVGLNSRAIDRYFGSIQKFYEYLRWDYEEKNYYNEVTNDELLAAYINLCERLGKVATASDIGQRGEYPLELYRSRFGDLSEVRRLCGYDYKRNKRSISKEECMDVMLNIYRKHGCISYGKLIKLLPFSYRTLLRKFGTTSVKDVWSEVEKRAKEGGK